MRGRRTHDWSLACNVIAAIYNANKAPDAPQIKAADLMPEDLVEGTHRHSQARGEPLTGEMAGVIGQVFAKNKSKT